MSQEKENYCKKVKEYYEKTYLQYMIKKKKKSKEISNEIAIDFNEINTPSCPSDFSQINLNATEREELFREMLQENNIGSERYTDLESGKICIFYFFPYEVIRDPILTDADKIYIEELSNNLSNHIYSKNINYHIHKYLSEKIDCENMVPLLTKSIIFILNKDLNNNWCSKKVIF